VPALAVLHGQQPSNLFFFISIALDFITWLGLAIYSFFVVLFFVFFGMGG
jgi:hypothetical protein